MNGYKNKFSSNDLDDVTSKHFGYTSKITVDEFKSNPIESIEIGSVHRTPKVMVFGNDMFFSYDEDEDFDIIVDKKYCDGTKEYIHRNLDAIAKYYMTKAYIKIFKNNPRALMNKISVCYGMTNNNNPYPFPPNYCCNFEYTVASFKKQAALIYDELSKYITVENNEYKGISRFCIDMDISKGSVLFYKLIAENHTNPRLKIIESLWNHKSIKDRFYDYSLDDRDTLNTFTVKNNCIPRSPFNDSDPVNRKQKRKKVKEKDSKLNTIVAKSMTAEEKYNALTNSGYFDFLESAFGLTQPRYSMKHLIVADQVMSRQNNQKKKEC